MTSKEKGIIEIPLPATLGGRQSAYSSGQRKEKTAGPKKARKEKPTLLAGTCTPLGTPWKHP